MLTTLIVVAGILLVMSLALAVINLILFSRMNKRERRLHEEKRRIISEGLDIAQQSVNGGIQKPYYNCFEKVDSDLKKIKKLKKTS